MATPNFTPKISSVDRDSNVGENEAVKRSSPRSTQEFRKIYDKDKDSSQSEQDDGSSVKKKASEQAVSDTTIADAANASAAVVSLFDLPKATTAGKVKTDVALTEVENVAAVSTFPVDSGIFGLERKKKQHKPGILNPHQQVDPSESPSKLFTKLNTKTTDLHPEEDVNPQEVVAVTNLDLKDENPNITNINQAETLASSQVTSTDKPNFGKFNLSDKEENTSATPPVNPVNFNLGGITHSHDVENPQAPLMPHLREVVTQIVSQLQLMTLEGKSETTIVLNDPDNPNWMFNGAQVTITEYSTATGQLNIAFENLSQQAQSLLVARSIQSSLIMTLEQQGYVVQNIIPTTIVEHPILVDSTATEDGRGGDNQNRGQQEQGQQKQKQWT